MNYKDVPTCTDKCRFIEHGDIITAAITKRSITDQDLCSFLNFICVCCETVRDASGRTALHMAASCGRTELVKWLVRNRHADINARDEESGYTALHRSIFYGKIDVAVELIKMGANVDLLDDDSLTMLEHAMKDGLHPDLDEGEAFVWGSNVNNSLGPQQTRSKAELLDVFHKEHPDEMITKVFLDQFHSVILTSRGSAYSCGHGQGGRLGLGHQQTEVAPKLIKFPSPTPGETVTIVQASISRDHCIFLTLTGAIYTCGLNSHFVLGITPPPKEISAPQLISRLVPVVPLIHSVSAGRFHSLAWNSNCLYTWGLNGGQLGHTLDEQKANKYIIAPKVAKQLNLGNAYIKLVSSSDGAIGICTDKGDIYVLHEYQCRKIASRQHNVQDICIIGGTLNKTFDIDRDINRELKVLILLNTGNLAIWQETDPQLCRCFYSKNRPIVVKQIFLNYQNVLFVTKDGEAFQGSIKPRKKKDSPQNVDKINVKSGKNDNGEFHKFLDYENCVLIKLTKFPRIHRAIFITSDPKGKDYCAIQETAYKPFVNNKMISSQFNDDFGRLLKESDIYDGVHDVVFKIGTKLFPAHKYIIATQTSYFEKQFLENDEVILGDKLNPDIFEQFLLYIYTSSCDLTQCGHLKNEKLRVLCDSKSDTIQVNEQSNNKIISQKSVHKNPLKMLNEMAKKFAYVELQKVLNCLEMFKYDIRKKKDIKLMKSSRFNRTDYSNYYDVTIKCRDDKDLMAHKCVLSARLDYFNNMFSFRWQGANTSEISLPFRRSVVEVLLEFLYTDILSLANKEIEHLFKVLILADQLCVTSLKVECERLLTDLITIKNLPTVLTFADSYNADYLKEHCMLFVMSNLASILDMHSLDEIENDLLKELTDFYCLHKPAIQSRIITPFSTAVSDEDITTVCNLYPVDMNEEKIPSKPVQKRRSRTHKQSITEKTSVCESPDTIIQFPDVLETPQVPENVNDSEEINSRLRAISLAKEFVEKEDYQPKFTKLNSFKITSATDIELGSSFEEFPELNSPPTSGIHYKSVHKSENKHKIVKMSQKQRKRLSSESSNTTVISESPKNPWKILPDISGSTTFGITEVNIGEIILDEKKQKENLVKIISKPLRCTQIEDKAIDDLRKFYNCDNVDDEIITVERVAIIGNVAAPVWVPRNKY